MPMSTVQLGEKVLLAGDSGSGKSTLVRAIAGLWPWGEGEITLKPGAKLFMMPQKPYIPLGTLRRAADLSAGSATDIDDAAIERGAGSGRARTRHRTTRREGRAMGPACCPAARSSGSLSRACSCTKPDIVVMDEATSALDTESQAMLMNDRPSSCPRIAIISVGHRAELEAFHERKLNLVRRKGGANCDRRDRRAADQYRRRR